MDEEEPHFLDLADDPSVSREELTLRFLESRGSRAQRPRRSAVDPAPADGSQGDEAVAPSQTRSGPTRGSEKRGVGAAHNAKPVVTNKLREPVCRIECFLNHLTTRVPEIRRESRRARSPVATVATASKGPKRTATRSREDDRLVPPAQKKSRRADSASRAPGTVMRNREAPTLSDHDGRASPPPKKRRTREALVSRASAGKGGNKSATAPATQRAPARADERGARVDPNPNVARRNVHIAREVDNRKRPLPADSVDTDEDGRAPPPRKMRNDREAPSRTASVARRGSKSATASAARSAPARTDGRAAPRNAAAKRGPSRPPVRKPPADAPVQKGAGGGISSRKGLDNGPTSNG
jgi:hypothetical protein